MRSQPREDSATMQTAVKTKTTPTPARRTCITSVKVASAPRICIGKMFQSTKPLTAFPANINAVNRIARLPCDDLQTPRENASNKRLDRVKRETTKPLVGAPIANNSLMAWAVKL